ncbi:MAG: aspartate aminotransferase family protein [Vicinamibacterales bacterium]
MTDHDSATLPRAEALSTAALLRDAAERGVRYRDAVAGRRVAPTAEALTALAGFDRPLPASGADPQQILDQLDRLGSPATVTMAGGRYFGFVNGSSLPVTVASNWLATAWDQNCALHVMSPAAATLEATALRWTLEALRLPADSGGAFVVGATMANFTALAAGRHAVLARAGWNVDDDGLVGAPPVTVAVGGEVHSTVRRVLGLLGLGRTRTVDLPVDRQGRIDAGRLPRLTGPALVCIQAGNVNTGAFDPAPAICDWAHAAGAWVHVDGAFGLWARAARDYAAQADGYDRADSWATDAHKWLNVPYDCGIAMVRDAAALRATMAMTAAYLPPSGVRDPMHYSPDGSRRARGVDVWAALAFLGRDGLDALVSRCCRHAARMAEGLRAAGHEVLNDVTLNQVLVAFGDDAATARVIAAVQAAGVCWCGGTRWQGREAMRISVSSYATTDADVDASLASILACATEVAGARP